MVDDVKGLSIIDLGCGFGWFCRYAHESGAKFVKGVDLSEKMLARARETSNPAITYERADLERIEIPAGSYDVLYSSLTMHYLPDDAFRGLLAQIHASLAQGGKLVFSNEHPVMMVPSAPEWKEVNGRLIWPLNDYWQEGLRVTDWLAKGIRKYHRTAETLVTMLPETRFTLTALKESWDDESRLADGMDHKQGHRSYFLLLAARK